MAHYLISVAIGVLILVIYVQSLNLITGYAGQPTLGHGAFAGIGAYTAAWLAVRAEWPFLAAVGASALIAGLTGMLVGLCSVRVKEDFLAITTMGVNFVVVAVLLYTPWFGGALGFGGIPAPLGSKAGFLGAVGALALMAVLLGAWLERSWAGLGWAALREEEAAAEAMGVDTRAYKLLAFTLGCALAGLGGALYAYHMGFISPTDFGFPLSIAILTAAVVGGLGTVRGAVAGAVLLGVLPELFRFVSDYRMLVYGALLLLAMRYRPEGLWGRAGLRPAGRVLARGRAGASPAVKTP